MGRLNLRYLITIMLIGLASVLSVNAFARGGGSPFAQLSCENGETYPILAKAVSAQGDLVTGYIIIPRRYSNQRRDSIYIRLMPMEHGYRYAGHGIWLDGVRRIAEINGGKNQSLACTVEFE